MFGVVPPEVNQADRAMEELLAALRQRDRRKVASFLCAGGTLQVLNTLERPYRRSSVACDRADDLDDLLFGDDGFRDYVVMAGRRPWRRKGALTYAPPYATGDPIHVRW